MRRACIFNVIALVFASVIQCPAEDFATLSKLADDFWNWRAKYAPFSSDDVNRMERAGGLRDWSRASMEARERQLTEFEERYRQIDYQKWPVPEQVDYRLIGSALARVRYELEVNARWKRDPNFYVEQTLTAVAEALTVPPPYDQLHSREILTRLQNIPSILQQGAENLKNPPAPFASVVIQSLEGVRERLRTMAVALRPATTLNEKELNDAADRAADALEQFQAQLKKRLPTLPQQTALGRDGYSWFLENVAMLPYSPEELLAMGRQEWNRAVAFESYEKERNRDVPPLKLASNTDSWVKDAAAKESAIREFLDKHG